MQSLNAILASANNQDQLKLVNNNYSEYGYINTESVTLISQNAQSPATITDPRPPAPNRGVNFTLVINADNVTLRNLKFTGKNAISLRINGDNCTLENLVFEDVRMAFVASGKNLRFKNITIRRFSEDGLRLASDGFHGENIRIEDLYAANKEAHHDGIQLYAGDPNSPLRSSERYYGRHAINKGYLKNVKIRSTTDLQRQHIGQLQGIFAADGLMDGLHFEDIYIETHNCLHGVSMRGLRTAQDGTPSRLKNITVRQTPGSTGDRPQINLWPARRLKTNPLPGARSTGFDSVLKVADDEQNLQDVMFPPDAFRTEIIPQGENYRPGPSMWQEIPNGAVDEIQNRPVTYEPMLELGASPVYQRLIAQ